MIWFLYNILFVFGFTLLLPRFLYRMWRRGGYRRDFAQRFGSYSAEVRSVLDGPQDRIWIHAVSVGEILVALRFMDVLREQRPDMSFALTTTTSTAYKLASDRIHSPDVLLYFPVDIPPIMRRVLKRIRPKMIVLVEAEFWPNLIRRARRMDIPVVLINGRISDRSFKGYWKLRFFMSRLLSEMNLFCMQSKEDADRLMALGAPPDRVQVMGSTKYEVAGRHPEKEAAVKAALKEAGIADDALLLLGGSTWPGEEAILMDIYQRLKPGHPELVLVLVPRHAERAGDVVREMEVRQLSYVRRSAGTNSRNVAPDVYLVDTTGELTAFYAWADVIFVGKSLTRHGGQNIIEPAIYAKPILVGPHMENFPLVLKEFQDAEALQQVPDIGALEKAIQTLLDQPAQRDVLGNKAATLVQQKVGALQRTIEQVSLLIDPHSINS